MSLVRQFSCSTQTRARHHAAARIRAWAGRHGPRCARVSLGIVFLWCGALKLVPGSARRRTSPAGPSSP